MSDISSRSDLINQLRVALPPEEFKKINFGELSDAELQAKLNEALTKNKNWGEFDGYERGTASAEQGVLTAETVVTYKNKAGDEVKEKRQGEQLVEKVTKHTDENGKIIETVITYQEGKPSKRTVRKDGETLSTTTYTSNKSDDGIEYYTLDTEFADGSKEIVNTTFVSQTGDYFELGIIDKTVSKGDETVKTYRQIVKSGDKEVVMFVENKQTSDGKTMITMFDNASYSDYTNGNVNERAQIAIIDGKVYEVMYDNNGNTITHAMNNDNLTKLAKNFNMTVDELLQLNPTLKKGLKVNQDVTVKGKYNADSPEIIHQGTKQEAARNYHNYVAVPEAKAKLRAEFEKRTSEKVIRANGTHKAFGSTSNYLGTYENISIKDFVQNKLKININSGLGKKVLERLAMVPYEELAKISYLDYESLLTNNHFNNFDEVAAALSVKSGLNIETNEEYKLSHTLPREKEEQNFYLDSLIRLVNITTNIYEQYYDNTTGTSFFMEKIRGLKGVDSNQIINKLKEMSNRLEQMKSLSTTEFKKAIQAEFGIKYSELDARQLMRMSQNPDKTFEEYLKEIVGITPAELSKETPEKQSSIYNDYANYVNDKYIQNAQKILGVNVVDLANEDVVSRMGWNGAGEMALMFSTLGLMGEMSAIKGVKMATMLKSAKAGRAVFKPAAKLALNTFGKNAAVKTMKFGKGVGKLTGASLLGGADMGIYNIGAATESNLAKLYDDRGEQLSVIDSGLEGLEIGIAGGIIGGTAVRATISLTDKALIGLSKYAKFIPTAPAKVTKAVDKLLRRSNGIKTGEDVMKTAMESQGPTKFAQTLGFGVEVAGFEVWNIVSTKLKNNVDPATGKLPPSWDEIFTTNYLWEHFKSEFKNIGQCKLIAKFAMFKFGSNSAQALMAKQTVDMSKSLKNIKIEPTKINGRELFFVTDETGKRYVLNSTQQVLGFCNFKMRKDMIENSLKEVATDNTEAGSNPEFVSLGRKYGRTITDFESEAKNNGTNYEVITDENGNRMVRRVVQSVEVLGVGKTTYEVTVFDKEGKQISDTVEMSGKKLKTAHPSFFTKKASTKAVDNSHTNFKSGSPNDIERPQDPFELDGKFSKEQMEQTGVDILKNTGLKNKKGKDIYETTPEADKIIFALAEQIREVALKNEPQIVQFMREMGFASDNSVFKDKDGNPIDISHRSKSVQSLHDKILNELLDDPKMNLAQAVNAVRDGVGVRTASKIIEDYSKFDDVKSALDKGDRATALEKAIEHESAETFKALMNYLQSVHDGTNKVEITRISNYMGADGIPYFTENQIHALKVEAERLGVDLPIFERVQSLAEKEIVKTKEAETGKEIKSNTQIRYSGYTGLQINFRVKETGFVFEWQNRGELVNEFAEKEHVPYDLRTGKDIIGKNTELNGLYGPIKEILGEDKMDKTVYTEYENYLAAHYEYLRLQELGFTEGVTQPKLPAGMDTRLRAENLDLLHTYAEKIKEKAADIREQGRKTGKTDAQIEAEVQQSVEPLIKEYQDKLVLNTPENTTTESYTEKAKSKENSRMISQYDAVTRLGGNHKNPNLPEINEIVEACKLNGKAISEKLIAHAEKLRYEEIEKDEIIKQVNELKAELYGIENKVNKQERKTFSDFELEARDNGTNYEVITDENGNQMVRRVVQSVEVLGMGKTTYEVTVFDKEGKQISDTVEMSGKELKTAHPSFFTKMLSTKAVDNTHAGTLGMNTVGVNIGAGDGSVHGENVGLVKPTYETEQKTFMPEIEFRTMLEQKEYINYRDVSKPNEKFTEEQINRIMDEYRKNPNFVDALINSLTKTAMGMFVPLFRPNNITDILDLYAKHGEPIRKIIEARFEDIDLFQIKFFPKQPQDNQSFTLACIDAKYKDENGVEHNKFRKWRDISYVLEQAESNWQYLMQEIIPDERFTPDMVQSFAENCGFVPPKILPLYKSIALGGTNLKYVNLDIIYDLYDTLSGDQQAILNKLIKNPEFLGSKKWKIIQELKRGGMHVLETAFNNMAKDNSAHSIEHYIDEILKPYENIGNPIEKHEHLDESDPFYQEMFDYYSNIKTKSGKSVFGTENSDEIKECAKYMASLPDVSKAATSMRMLTELVTEEQVGVHVLHYLPKEGEINPLISQEVQRFYEAYINNIPFEDVICPTFKSKNPSDVGIGDVFEVEGDKNIYIKNEDGSSTQLKIDKETYCKLFPPIERYATTQNKIGNCWQLTGFNGLLRDPIERQRVLECFSQDGNDIIINFPNGKLKDIRFKNGQLPEGANPMFYSEGALGVNVLEFAQAREMAKTEADAYLQQYKDAVENAKTPKEKQEAEETLAFMTSVVEDNFDNTVFEGLPGHLRISSDKSEFDFAINKYRDGGNTDTVLDLLGYEDAQRIDMSNPNDKYKYIDFLSNPETYQNYLVGLGSKHGKQRGLFEQPLEPDRGLVTGHAYWLRPEFGTEGKPNKYNTINPWGIVEGTFNVEEIFTHHDNLYIAKRRGVNDNSGRVDFSLPQDGRVPSLDAPQDGATTRGIQDNAGAKETIAQIQGKNIKILDNGTKRVTEPIKWTTQDGKSLEYTLIRDYTADKNIMYRVIDKDNTVVGEWYGFISEDKHESYLKGYSLWTDRSGRNTSGLGTELKKLIYNDAKNYNCNSIKIDAAYKSHTFHNKMGYKCDITNDYLEPIIATLKVIKLKNTIPEFNGRIENVLGNKNIVEINLLIDDILSYANSNDLRSEDIGIKDIKIPMKYELKNDNSGRVDFSLPQDGRVPSLDAPQDGSRSALPSRQSDGAIKGDNATFTPTKTDGAIPTVPTKSSAVVQAESELSGVAKGINKSDVSEIAEACVDSDGNINKGAFDTAKTFLKLGRDKAFILTMVQKFVKPKPATEVNNAEITQPVKAEEKPVQNPAETIQHSKTEDEFKTYIQGLNRYKSSTIGILTNLYKTHGDIVLEMVNKTKIGSTEPRFTDMDIITFMNSKHKDFDIPLLDATVQQSDGNRVEKFTPKDVRLIRDTIRDDNKLKPEILKYIKDNLANDDTVSSDVVLKFVKTLTKETEVEDFDVIVDILKRSEIGQSDKTMLLNAYNGANTAQRNQIVNTFRNNPNRGASVIINDVLPNVLSSVKEVRSIIDSEPILKDIPDGAKSKLAAQPKQQVIEDINNLKTYLSKHPDASPERLTEILLLRTEIFETGEIIDTKSIIENDLYDSTSEIIRQGQIDSDRVNIRLRLNYNVPKEVFDKNKQYILDNNITDAHRIIDIMKRNIDYEARRAELAKSGKDPEVCSVLQRVENISDISGIEKFVDKIRGITEEIEDPSGVADILNKAGIDNYADFNKYIEGVNISELLKTAPSMSDFTDKQWATFFAFHYQNNTKTFDNTTLAFRKDFTNFLADHYISAENMADLFAAFPNVDRNVGELPKDWFKGMETDNIETRTNAVRNLFADFSAGNIKPAMLSLKLTQNIGKNVKVTALKDDGKFKQGYKIEVEGCEPVFLGVFKQTTEFEHPLHGKDIEVQAGLFLNGRTEESGKPFVHSFGGRLGQYVLNQFMTADTAPIETAPKSGDFRIKSNDVHRHHNVVGEKDVIIDNGNTVVTKLDGSDASFGLFKKNGKPIYGVEFASRKGLSSVDKNIQPTRTTDETVALIKKSKPAFPDAILEELKQKPDVLNSLPENVITNLTSAQLQQLFQVWKPEFANIPFEKIGRRDLGTYIGSLLRDPKQAIFSTNDLKQWGIGQPGVFGTVWGFDFTDLKTETGNFDIAKTVEYLNLVATNFEDPKNSTVFGRLFQIIGTSKDIQTFAQDYPKTLEFLMKELETNKKVRINERSVLTEDTVKEMEKYLAEGNTPRDVVTLQGHANLLRMGYTGNQNILSKKVGIMQSFSLRPEFEFNNYLVGSQDKLMDILIDVTDNPKGNFFYNQKQLLNYLMQTVHDENALLDLVSNPKEWKKFDSDLYTRYQSLSQVNTKFKHPSFDNIIIQIELMKKLNPKSYDELVRSKGYKDIKSGKINPEILKDIKYTDKIDENYFYNLYAGMEQKNDTNLSTDKLKDYDKSKIDAIIELDPTLSDRILHFISNAKDKDVMANVINMINSRIQNLNTKRAEREGQGFVDNVEDITKDNNKLIEIIEFASQKPEILKLTNGFTGTISQRYDLAKTISESKLEPDVINDILDVYKKTPEPKFKFSDVNQGIKFIEKFNDIELLNKLKIQFKNNLTYILSNTTENNFDYLKERVNKGIFNGQDVFLQQYTKSIPEFKNPDRRTEITDLIKDVIGFDKYITEYTRFQTELNNAKSGTKDIVAKMNDLTNKFYAEKTPWYYAGLVDMKLHTPEKYQKIKETGFFDMVESGYLPRNSIYRLNHNSDLTPNMYADLQAVKEGRSIIPEFAKGTPLGHIFSKTEMGDAVAIGDKMYINDGENLVVWKMTKEKYLELFPPVLRFASGQQRVGNCFFVTSLFSSMEDSSARPDIYKSFELNGNDVVVTIKAYEDYDGSTTYENSNIVLPLENRHMAGCKGLQMYEQAYARVALREERLDPLPSLTMDTAPQTLMARVNGGKPFEVMSEIHGIDNIARTENGKVEWNTPIPDKGRFSIGILFQNNSPDAVSKLEGYLERFVKKGSMVKFGTIGKPNADAESMLLPEYNIVSEHAYSVSGYDKNTKTVIISNPHNGAIVTHIPIDILTKYISNVHITKFN